MSRLLAAGFVLALVLIVTGVAAIYWPAALIVSGIGLGAVCLLVNDGSDAEQQRGGQRR